MTENPLKQFYRAPSLFLKLPSNYVQYDENTVTKTDSGEFPIYPMTVRDELLLKTPDALMNGEATKQVIESCVPNIKNASKIISNDLDAVLISIRIASYGEMMNIDSSCPKCSAENSFDVDLRVILDNISNVTNKTFETENFTVFIIPHTFESLNSLNLQTFEQQKILNLVQSSIENNTSDEQRINSFRSSLQKMSNLALSSITDQIKYIQIKDGEKVTNKDHIIEFINNCDKKIYNKIKDQITLLNNEISVKPLNVECGACQHKYTIPLEFNATNFFV